MCNITFGYAIVALASTCQLATVELEYKPVTKVQEEVVKVIEQVKEEVQENPSLIASKPLDFDTLLQSTKAQQNDLRLLARGVSISPINTISRDMLRQIAEIISHIQRRIEAVRKASQAVENHLDVCFKEYSRQVRVITSTRDTLGELRDTKSQTRAVQMVEKQKNLAERLDSVVRGLTGRYRPDLGESEKRWFDELDRIGNRLRGTQSNAGLFARAQMVSIFLLLVVCRDSAIARKKADDRCKSN